ncbi:ATP synthase subunit I [Histophilus somni]|uniref:ATP synthase protein I n=1 Tax=Histophilus somni (strain 129Pt) TaxID=205914 RepID=Q0I5W6_HISS1|nr:ATP synthase subunit I [Histophilus somni]QEH17073.1 F0F1 ATP synthase subunit I [Histophilus somni]QEH22479.1 F0F1 ATP synthase subunit I [Histophilus somni]QQF86131.1 ATP synthase subunit I [Histophilus somni]QQJ90065.1 ATP synthase subunit I [Histophilus somni]THA21423.1 F0F1 ATP synthase subunit I [Histophilus somni]
MSAVIKKTQKRYKISLLIEFFIFMFSFVLLSIGGMSDHEVYLSFLFGALSVFIPYCLFVYLMFFTNKKYKNNLKMFYSGELIKFILTIILVVFIFKTFKVDFKVFFVGYLISIVLNNLLPFMVNKYLKI